MPEGLIVQIALTAVVYFVASCFSDSYNPLEWDFLAMIIAAGIVWNVWDPS